MTAVVENAPSYSRPDPGTELPVIELVRPLHGFPDQRAFALVQLGEDGMLCAMRSMTDASLRFLVVPAARFYPEYAPVIDDDVVADLAIESAEQVLVLLVLTAGDSLATTTVNLLAPVLVNTDTRRAAQVVLDADDLPTRAPLIA